MNNPMIETRTIKVWLDEEGILRIVTKPGITQQTLSDAVENMDAVEKARLGKKRPVFVDIREAMSTDSEGRKYYTRPELVDLFSAGAFVVGSPISRVIGGLYLGLNRPPFPIRLFTSESEALDWLRNLLE